MKALVLEARSRLAVRDVATPEPKEDEVLVAVDFSGVCGTDVHGYAQGEPLRHPPVVMGHEFTGRLVDGGERVVVNPRAVCGRCDECAAGCDQRCDSASTLGVHTGGGFAELVAVPASSCVAIPQGLDPRVAALTEPLAVGLHGANVLASHLPLRGAAIGVIGAGVVGLSVALTAQRRGARVTVADRSVERRAQASRHGIAEVVESLEGTFAATVEAVGHPAARADSVGCLRPGGVALWIGLDTAPAELDVTHLVRGERAVVTSYCYTGQEFREAVGLCAEFAPDELALVRLDDGPGVFEGLLRGGGGGPHARTVFDLGGS